MSRNHVTLRRPARRSRLGVRICARRPPGHRGLRRSPAHAGARQTGGAHHEPVRHRSPATQHHRLAPRRAGPDAGRALLTRARHPRRGRDARSLDRRREDRAARPFAVRRHREADGANARGDRRPDLRHPGPGCAAVHVRVHARARDASRGREGDSHRRAGPAESGHRNHSRGEHPRARLPVVRRHLSGSLASRDDAGRAGGDVQRGAADRRRLDRRAGRRLAARHVVGRDGTALGEPVAQYPAARRRDPLPRHGVLRGDEWLGGARHGPAVRANRCALAQEHRGRRGHECDEPAGHPIRSGRVPHRGDSAEVSRPDAEGRALHPDRPRLLSAAGDVVADDPPHPAASPRSIPVGGRDARAPRRQRAAAAGDRGRHASRATARVGARPSDVSDKAGPLPHLPVNILLGGLLAMAAADTLWLQNAGMRLGFDSSNGSLFALTDRSSGRSFVDGRQATAIWRLDRFGPGDSSVVPSSARRFAWHELTGEGPGPGVALVWSDFGLSEAPALRVTVTVRLLRDSALSEWRIVVDSPGALAIEQVRFPRLARIPPLGRGEELAVPRWMGALARDPATLLAGPDRKGRRFEWAYPGTLSLQVMALYRRGRDGAGLYAAADDTLAYRKTFAVWGDSDGSRGYELVHPFENPASPRTEWAPPYAALLGTFQGDWITVAERYRAWGTRQPWARNSRLVRGRVPAWLLRTGMWVWNRGRSPGVVPPALALQRALGLPVNIHWHWWHHGPYDTSFPDYLPPREGVDSFRAGVAAAHAAGSHAMVYMNQRLWCTGTPSWSSEHAARWAVKEKDGRVREETYNTFDPQPCATMDVTTPFWRAKYAHIADTVLDLYGADGIYMDQAVQSLVCWDSTHGHPVGGGNYWMGGFRALATRIRAAGKPGRPVLLAGEGAGEPWLPELDLMLTLQVSQERYTDPGSGWEPIPFFQAVY